MFQSKWVSYSGKNHINLAVSRVFLSSTPVLYRFCLDIGDSQLLIHEIQVSNLDEDQRTPGG